MTHGSTHSLTCYQPPDQPALLLAPMPLASDILTKLLQMTPSAVIQQLEQSGLRGRGGAGFYTAKKWQLCQQTPATAHFVVCNADEGEPGTFKDRLLLQVYLPLVLVGMAVCGYAINAQRGFIYLRVEYQDLLPPLEATLAELRQQRCLGAAILGSSFHFDISVTLGAEAYICGEETALLESLEGKRGIPRIRPPFPVTQGYQQQPTVVNNVETLAAASKIVYFGADWFKRVGTPQSTGTKLISISGDCTHPGVYEYAWGTPLRQVLTDCGAGEVQAVQLSGAAGHLLAPAEFDRKLAFEDLATGGSLIVFNPQRNLLQVVQRSLQFFRHESCGFCTPCRVGTRLLDQLVAKFGNGHGSQLDLDNLRDISQVMTTASFCGLGQTAANLLLDSLEKFPDSFHCSPDRQYFAPGFDLDAALAESRQCRQQDKPT